MKNTSAYAVLTRFGIIAAVLATLVFIAPAATAQVVGGTCNDDFKCTYPENAEGAVEIFGATDEEGDAIKWSLEGDDAGDFDITVSGVLSFKSSPNFESPADKDENNTYKVTLVATGGKQAVEVKVTDVDEPATVSFTGNRQPQVGNPLQAKVEDPDGDKRTTGNVWRWEKGPDRDEGPWTAIAGAIASSYTPTRDDVGNFLRATVTYSDRKFKKKDTQSGVSELAVRRRPASNSAPVFAASAPDTIEVEEEVKGPIGDPIEATDPDNDSLYYELPSDDGADLGVDINGDDSVTADDDHDNARFMISDTGQLSLEKGLNFEQPTDDAANSNTDDAATTSIREYTAVVRVTDPSGASEHKVVVVQVTPVDEAPKITGSAEIKIKESTALAPDVQISSGYTVAADPEGDTAGTWTLEGDDAAKFAISASGDALTFAGLDTDADKFRPNFEKPADDDKNNKYQVTVVVPYTDTDGDDRKSAKLAVTVIVQQGEDQGTLMLSQLALHVGRPVRATIDDPDGDTSRERWRWYRNATSATVIGDLTEPGDSGDAECEATTTTLCRIATARAANYTPTKDDMGKTLAVKATYRDPVSPDTDDDPSIFTVTEAVLARTNVNLAPEFRDTAGNPLESETVEVQEGTAADTSIGDAIVAIDDDGESLLYSLDDGADASHFKIVRTDGQLQTKTVLDYEKPVDANGDNAYEVIITAMDPSGATDTIPVTIMVTNKNEGAKIALATAEVSGTCKDDFKCTYPENAEGAVGAFGATDEEGDAIKWSLEGDDAGDFDITVSGVLSFKSSPNFESPADKDENNTYKVTLVATGGKQAVEVKVTDVDEPATVSFTGNRQPQVGNPLQAKVEDPDGDKRTTGNVWRWEKGPDRDEGPWTAIAGAIASSYTPTRDDVGNFLRATVTYSDRKFKKKDTQSGVSELAVRRRPASNSAPVFAASAPDTIEVEEEVKGPIGDPIEATDPDNDSLYYELPSDDGADLGVDINGDDSVTADDDHDNARFMISDTGQLSLEKGLNFEQPTDDAANSNTDDAATTSIREYTAVVRVTDPSGASEHKVVVVQVTPVDEAPKITGSAEIKIKESTALAPDVQISSGYTVAADPEGDTAGTWTLEGDDAAKFAISASGDALTFAGLDTDADKFRPNFEKPADDDKNNKYQVTVVVPYTDTDGDDRKSAKLAVTVIVQQGEDQGTLMLSQLALHVGRPVRATIDDPDGDTSRERWRWYRNATSATVIGDLTEPGDSGDAECEATTTTLCRIATARAANYTPTKDDMGKTLAVKATYRDPVSPDTDDDPSIFTVTEAVLARTNVNLAPEFRDTAGNPLESETVEVQEGTAADTSIGDAIVAIDDDGESLLYSLDDGADASHFKIVRTDGQLQTKTVLDYEKPVDANGDNAYEVIITAMDPSGATDTIPVTIMVTNKNEGAKIELQEAPAFDAETAEREVAENSSAGTPVGDPVAATDPNGDDLTYSLDEMGDMYFDIDAMGQITVGEGAMLDYESDMKSYSVTVTAMDVAELTDTIAVTIMVTDVNDAPTFDALQDELGTEMIELSVDENSEAGTPVGDPVVATDQDGDELTYSLDEMGDMYFDIDESSGQITVGEGAMLDYESDMKSYSVTVTASDGEATDMVMVTVMVDDVEESPCVIGGAVEAGNDALAMDCDTLLAAMDELIGDGTAKLDWSAETPIGDWEGVAGRGTGRVGGIYLVDEGLSGVIPASFANLAGLERLTLRDNDLGGEIPDLSGLANLERLSLQRNAFTGSLPDWLGDMESLDRLYIYGNEGGFEGGVPAGLGNSTSLRQVWLHDNGLTGEIPSEIGNMSRLRYLILSGNSLSGSIPAELGDATNLKQLYLHNNMLTGSIPAELGSIMSAADDTLRRLYLNNNMLSGDVPSELGMLTSLTHLRLSGNMLTGCVPADIFDAVDDGLDLMACDDGS